MKLWYLLPLLLVLSGCFSSAAIDTRYSRRYRGPNWNGPEKREASSEKTERVTVRRGDGGTQFRIVEHRDGSVTIERTN